MVNHDEGRTLAVILGTLRELGYLVEWQVVNTRWWLPQNRERIYILARYNGNPSGRKVLPIYPPSRETTERSEEVTIADWRSDEGLRIRKNGISPTLTRATPPYIIKAHSLYPRSSTTGQGGTGHLSKEDGTSYCLDTGNCQAVEIIDKKGKKKNNQDYAACLSGGGHSGGNHSDMDLLKTENTKIRRLTPVECARLQGFPDDWNDCQSDSQRYKQYGNSISVPISESIFNKLYKEK